ncbi:MAG TPA: hypothetical protein VGZ26_05630 [Pirellulales bacterium]|nr:hypothetical protein [Pirellulales bacterium]
MNVKLFGTASDLPLLSHEDKQAGRSCWASARLCQGRLKNSGDQVLLIVVISE